MYRYSGKFVITIKLGSEERTGGRVGERASDECKFSSAELVQQERPVVSEHADFLRHFSRTS